MNSERELPVYFGDWLKQRRKVLDLTQEALAQRAGCSVFALRKIETGERKPSRQLAEWLAKSLDLPEEVHPVFIRAARGDLNLERLPLPDLSPPPENPPSDEKEPSTLPVFFTSLVGRASELAALKRIFGNPQCRMITLTGPGGIGKTRLAVEFAATQTQEFPGGIFYIPLAALHSPALIVPAMAEGMRITFSGSSDLMEQLIQGIRSNVEARSLVVLDNMEHLLVENAVPANRVTPAELIAEMLQRLPEINFLVTSRERLNLQGEWTYELHGLPAPPEIFLDRMEDYSATALFIQSARRVNPALDLSHRETQQAIVKICRLLEGSPLAIELAAAWAGLLSIYEIAAEIASNIDFLTTTMRDVPERHRSLRATFDHSWKLLSESERTVLQRLSIFRGGFTRESAAKIAGARLHDLAGLVSKSLISRTDEGRYDLHEIIRQYSRVHLSEDPGCGSVCDLHSEFFLSLVAEKEHMLKSPHQQTAVSEITAEIDNLRTAWRWAIEQQTFDLIFPAVRGMCWYYENAGLLPEGIEHFELLIHALKNYRSDTKLEKLLGMAMAQQSLLLFRRGLFREARVQLEKCLDILRPYKEPALLTDALIFLGIICHLDGELDLARQIIQEGQACAEAGRDRWFEAYAIYNLGYIDSLEGNFEQGLVQLEKGLEIWRDIGDPNSISLGLNHIASTLIQLDRMEEAASHLLESIRLTTAAGNRWGLGTAYRYLGMTRLAQGACEEAIEAVQMSLDVFAGYVTGWDIAISLIILGDAYLAAGNTAEAETRYFEGLRTAESANSPPLILDASLGLAEIYADRYEDEKAGLLAGYVDAHPLKSWKNAENAVRILQDIRSRGSAPEAAPLNGLLSDRLRN